MHMVACGTADGMQEPNGNSVLSQDTVVLDNESLEALVDVTESTAGAQTLVFADAAAVAEIEPGNVIVAGPSTAKPEGFLLRVADVTERGGRFYVEATQATLEEAVVDVAVAETFAATRHDIDSFAAAPGVEILPERVLRDVSWSPGAIELAIHEMVVYDHDGNPETTDDQVQVDGVVGVVPQFDIDIDIQSWGVQTFRFENRNEHFSDLQVDSRAPIDLSHTFTVASIQFAPVVVNIGIPLVFTPQLDVKVGVEGTLSGALRVGVSATATTGTSVLYEGGEWSGDWYDPASNLEVVLDGPHLDAAEGSLRISVGPEGSFKLYGVVGPTARIRGYFEFNAELIPERAWQLYAGIDSRVGLEAAIPVVGPSVGVYAEVFDFNWLLAEGEF
jgi:hypothetical protein